MPIYKMDGKKDGLQKYRVRINFVDKQGKSRQIDRVAYGKDAAKELELRLSNENQSDNITKKITVQQLYDEYIVAKKYEVRETTIDKSKKLLTTFVLPPLKDYRLDRLTASVLQSWKNQMEQETTSAGEKFSLKYKRNIFGELRALLNYAVKMEYISKNPLSALGNFKDVNLMKKEMDFYTPEEFKKFISAARHQAEQSEAVSRNIYEWNFYVFFNIAFFTGMRKGEIYALKWSDMSGTTIKVCRSIAQKLRGGDRETPPKNQSSIRTIDLPLPLKKILDEHYSRCKGIADFSDDWRICGGKQCIRDSTLENRNKYYAELAGIKKIRIHDFRHSHASLLANNGINIQEIARRLGHSNIEITWNIYSHLYPRESERAIEILNKIV